MSISTTINAIGADQWDACCIPGSALIAGHYDFDSIGGLLADNSWQRGLLYFSLATITPGALFSSASIKVYHNSSAAATNTHNFEFYRVTSEWNSFYVSNTQRDAGPTNWSSAGGDYTDLCSALGIASDEGAGWKTWAFTASGKTILKNMNDGVYNNYGFLLKSSTEDDNCLHTWDDANDTYKPYLSVTYTLPSVAQMSTVFF